MRGLKEWAVVVRAMDEGRQLFLVRSGGISEETGEFHLKSREFFLFPTYAHQREESLQERFRHLLKEVLSDTPPASQVVIGNYAVVEDNIPVASLEGLNYFTDEYIWTPEFLADRVSFGGPDGARLLLLRVYRLPVPSVIQALPEYGGCKSWVDLRAPLTIEGAVPVLRDEEFHLRADRIRKLAMG